MKKKEMQKIFICPKCGSTNLKVTSKNYFLTPGVAAEAGELGVVAGLKECGDCGYVGPALEVAQNKLKEVQDKLRK